MADGEHVARGPDVDDELFGAARRQQHRRGFAGAIAGANDAVVDHARGSVREDIHELGGEVGISGGRRRPQPHFERSGHFDRRRQRIAGVDENVGPQLDLALVGRDF